MSPINRSTLTRSEPLCALDAKGLNMRSGRCARAVRKTQIGFTLIELMVVVGLVAILTAIAMPSYTDYIKRGQIVDGIVPLADSALRWRQEVSVPLITGGTAPGLILPGYLIEVQEPGETWRGLVRNLSLDEDMPEFTQTLTVDRFQ